MKTKHTIRRGFPIRSVHLALATRDRAHAEKISAITTRAMIESRIAAVRSVSICMTLRFKYHPCHQRR